jgi:hypothetical protein
MRIQLPDFFGIIVFLFCDWFFRVITQTLIQQIVWYGITTGFIIVITYSFFKRKKQNTFNTFDDCQPINLSDLPAKELIDWASTDKPEENKDFFGHILIAKRIAQYLSDARKENHNISIGLIGDYGSGKSTTINLMLPYIPKDYIVCQVSCWGFANVSSALEYILSKIIATIEEHGIDTNDLHSIPKQYVRVLAKINSIFDVFSFLFESPTPEELLQKIGNVLQCEQKQLLLIIDDLDRNEVDNFKVDDVIATSMKMKNVPQLSFILTGFPRSGKWRIDFEKICDYIEILGMIDNTSKFKIIHNVSEYLYYKNTQDYLLNASYYIDQAEDCDRLSWLSQNGGDDEDRTLFWGSLELMQGHFTWMRPLLNLISTPRILKFLIRDVSVAWERLHGECDYIELLIWCSMRFSNIPYCDFIIENIEKLRSDDTEMIRELKKDINTFVKEYSINRKDFCILLDSLFYNGKNLGVNTYHNYRPTVRGVCNSGGHVDYFKRILDKHFLPEESDQKQLRAIRDWNRERNPAIVDIIADTNAYNFELHCRWLNHINEDSLFDLTKTVIEKLKDNFVQKQPLEVLQYRWHIMGRYYWKNMKPSTERFTGIADWFEEIFELIVPCNIVLCTDVLFSLCFVDTRITRPERYRISSGPCVEEYTITENQFEEVFTRLIQVCRTTFNSPEKIATACSTEHYECIKGLIYITQTVNNRYTKIKK